MSWKVKAKRYQSREQIGKVGTFFKGNQFARWPTCDIWEASHLHKVRKSFTIEAQIIIVMIRVPT